MPKNRGDIQEQANLLEEKGAAEISKAANMEHLFVPVNNIPCNRGQPGLRESSARSRSIQRMTANREA